MAQPKAVQAQDGFAMRYATQIAVAVVTVLMASALLIFHRQNEAVLDARDWVNHTYEVAQNIQNLQIMLETAVVAERGYLLTGDERLLRQYDDAFAGEAANNGQNPVNHKTELLRHLVGDNPVQRQNIDRMERAVKALLAHLADAIDKRRTQGDKALPGIDMREGMELLERVRDLLSVMQAEENNLLDIRKQRVASNIYESGVTVSGGIALTYLLMVFAIVAYQRARRLAQLESERYTQQLERNEEELKMQQEELKASNEEIETANEELEEQNIQIRQQADELKKSKEMVEETARQIHQASRYKSEFLANMSHELRTPLNSLLILARSLAANEDGNLTPEQVEEASIIHNDGLELLYLINDVLDLSKIEAGKLSILAENVAPASIVQRLQQQFAPMAREKNIAFEVEVGRELPPYLHTDVQRVEQILKNLISNAIKFTDKGSVRLRVSRPEKSQGERADKILFSVIDTGIGIDPARQRDIFEAFQQEDGSTERHYGGTGLGLTIARKMAHLLGGEIHVESRKGEGSVFTLTIPAYLENKQPPLDIKPPAAETALNTIYTELKAMPRMPVDVFLPDDRDAVAEGDKVLLIIEDDRNFAATLMKIARRRGYKCLTAGTGKDGLVLAMDEPVAAIILDVKLPDIGGMQVLDHLKHNLKTRHIPVHIVTGMDIADGATSLRKGAIGYAVKPMMQEGIDGVFARIEAMMQAKMKHVLVVEDNRESQVAIQNLLKQKDINITIAGAGQTGLEQARDEKFDCIILDMRLPDMTGFEWLERAEKDCKDGNLPPVIVYTAQDLSEEENRRLNHYTGSIVIKGARSPERLLDEVTLFLHSVESTLSKNQHDMMRMRHDPDRVLADRMILLVDDDLRNTFALSKLLRKHGVSVVIADNGQMALDKLRENPGIDLVIMDIMMPVMDGYQAMRAIRAQRRYADLPMIALTARAMPEEQAKCIAAGANDYLTKPVDVEWLLTLLRVWLFRQEMAS